MDKEFNGLFICKDKNGENCTIGDLVAITEPEILTQDRKGNVTIHESTTYIGKLEMNIKSGFYLKGDGIHFQPPLHDSEHSFNAKKTWQWLKC